MKLGAILKQHEHYIETLKADGKLGAAGAIDPPNDLFALVIFRTIPLEEAKLLPDDDPAVKTGVLRVEYHQWWSSDHVLPW
jgi:uncharacterized protein YciI